MTYGTTQINLTKPNQTEGISGLRLMEGIPKWHIYSMTSKSWLNLHSRLWIAS
jgi:hypothetical protein